jgi:hypothetical protein
VQAGSKKLVTALFVNFVQYRWLCRQVGRGFGWQNGGEETGENDDKIKINPFEISTYFGYIKSCLIFGNQVATIRQNGAVCSRATGNELELWTSERLARNTEVSFNRRNYRRNSHSLGRRSEAVVQ